MDSQCPFPDLLHFQDWFSARSLIVTGSRTSNTSLGLGSIAVLCRCTFPGSSNTAKAKPLVRAQKLRLKYAPLSSAHHMIYIRGLFMYITHTFGQRKHCLTTNSQVFKWLYLKRKHIFNYFNHWKGRLTCFLSFKHWYLLMSFPRQPPDGTNGKRIFQFWSHRFQEDAKQNSQTTSPPPAYYNLLVKLIYIYSVKSTALRPIVVRYKLKAKIQEGDDPAVLNTKWFETEMHSRAADKHQTYSRVQNKGHTGRSLCGLRSLKGLDIKVTTV